MIHLQVQASDVWDMQFLKEHLKRMKEIILSILDDDSTTATSLPSSISLPTEDGDDRLPSEPKAPNETFKASGVSQSSHADSASSSTVSGEAEKKMSTNGSEAPRSQITATNEIPYPGYHFTPTIHHDTYPTINPLKADLSGKVVFVSGASRGIGRSIAISFAKAGAAGIVIAARTVEDLKAVEVDVLRAAAEANKSTRVLRVYLDLLDEASIRSLASQVREEFGRLDVIVNNAATIDRPLPLSSNDMDDWWTPFTVNVRGTQSVTRSLLPLLKSTEAGAKVVINIVSSNSLTATPYCSGYGVSFSFSVSAHKPKHRLITSQQLSKLALLQMSEILHKEHKAEGVTVLAVHPGSVATAMTSMVPEGRRHILIDTPELCADTLVWLAKEQRGWLGGRYISSTWDMRELESMKERIASADLLRVTLAV